MRSNMAHVDANNPSEFDVLVVPNDLRSIIPPKEAILTALVRNGYSESDMFAIKLALEEALTNAVKHGALSTGGRIEIEWRHATGSDPMLEVVWQEVGGPAAAAPYAQPRSE